MAVGIGLAAVGIVTSLWGGYKSSQASRLGGSLARDAAYANAEDALALGELNANYVMQAAENNARSILTIGEVNANYVERSTQRNMMLFGLEADEDVRRFVRYEKVTAGAIRTMAGAAGVQTNTGSPLYYLNDQMNEGIRQRKFMTNKHLLTLWRMEQEGSDQAYIYRVTARENANVTLANAALQAEVTIAESLARAEAERRGGDIAYKTGQAQASAAMWQGVAGAVNAGIGAYSAFASPTPTTGVPKYISSSTQPALGNSGFATTQGINQFGSNFAAGLDIPGVGNGGYSLRMPRI